MEFFTDIASRVRAIRDLLGEVTDPAILPVAVEGLDDDAAVTLLELASGLGQAVDRLRTAAVGVVAQRSTRHAGHAGLAQSRGHRNAVSLLQQVAGVSRTEAQRQVRVGESLYDSGASARGSSGGISVAGSPGVEAPGTGGAAISGTAEPGTAEPGTADPGTAEPGTAEPGGTEPGATEPGARGHSMLVPWHAPLGKALLSGVITLAQHDAIAQGLGQPPLAEAAAGSRSAAGSEGDTGTESGTDTAAAAAAESAAAWSLAAEHLIDEAAAVTVEELAKAARNVRDLLDPVGAEERFLARHEARSFRMWTDRDGATRASITFDDLSAAWMRSVIDAAMRPRRGGPRFVDPSEEARATALMKDPRTNDQLVFDLLIDVVRAGTLADTAAVCGARQPGVRLVQILPGPTTTLGTVSTTGSSTDAFGADSPDTDDPDAEGSDTEGSDTDTSGLTSRRTTGGITTGASTTGDITTGDSTDHLQHLFAGPAYTEDGIQHLPGWVAQQHACTVGTITVTTDEHGNPLNLGRSSRLYTSKQRIALAVRDGGCRWRECDRVASYCEAHHIDSWAEGEGRTDIDRGILLCRFHHMQLHHRGWRITRDGQDVFVLHDPEGGATEMPRRVTYRYAWAGNDPPPPRFRIAA